MACDAQSLVTAAYANGYAKLSYRGLVEAIVASACAGGGGGGGGGGQILVYTGANPTADGLTPTNTANPAIAYKKDGTDATWVWNTTTLVWN